MTDNRTSDQIEREIAAERSALARAMDDLQATFSSERIVGSLSDSLRSVGGDLAVSVSETVRKNPVPAALIGFGLAWLAASAARSSSGHNGASGTATTYDHGARSLDDLHGDDRSDDGFIASLRDSAAGMSERASEKLHSLLDTLTAGTEGMSEEARRRIVAAREAALTAQLKLEDGYARAKAGVARTAQEQPLAIGGAALVGGAVVGALLPGTETEDRAFGAYRDRLMDDAERIYRDERRKLEAAASAALDETRAVLKDTVGGNTGSARMAHTAGKRDHATAGPTASGTGAKAHQA